MFTKMKNSILYSLSGLTALTVVKFFVATVGVANMILMPTYSTALLLLENSICGFVMFLFILAGLVAMFGALRLDAESVGKTLFACLGGVLSIVTGVMLIHILMYALYYQASIHYVSYPASYMTVLEAVNLGIGMCVAYGIGLGGMVGVHIHHSMRRKKEV